ncbi:MAG: DUF4115 domain-containing protein [Zoogloea sp.]|uniref:helix-turn-helix domain-containing protein n=1 Tax=Zoogloea sp. TaxID=49181 RepID=UPI00262E0E38|nr:helix-turn-helix domain-containing protein [Zoogloea sp.]MDD3326052.1 DUF4115 domain-containing protein [Zoogloea sp.]
MTDSQAVPSSAPTFTQDTSVGDTLRRTREAQGLSISEVANALKLNPRQIEALESGRFAQLPGLAFTRGFLRNYARLLKIDAAPLLAGIQAPDAGEQMELAPASNAHGDMPQVGRGRFRRSVIPGVLAALALFGIVVAGWYYDTLRKKPAEELALPAPEAPPGASANESPAVPPQAAEPAPAAVESAAVPAVAAPAVAGVPVPLSPTVTEAAPAAAPSQAPAADAGGDRLVFQFAQDAWVEVKDKGGKVVFSRLGKAGSQEEVVVSAPVSLVVGNARHVKLQRNGTAIDIPTPGKVTVGRLKLD